MNTTPIETLLDQQQRIALLLAYYGPGFSGSQMQENAYTVQQALDEALTRLNVEHGAVFLAGRTDAGVHAKGQIAHFDVADGALANIPCLRSALNGVLPQTVSVEDVAFTSDTGFHATASAEYRWYQYRIYNAPQRSVWMRPDATWVKQTLNLERMQEAARYFLGEQDFNSLKCARSTIPNTVCNVIHSDIRQDGDNLVFDVVANRFIYKMVRNMVGLLLEIGLEKGIHPADVPEILASRNRNAAGPTASPQGLSLMAIHYPETWDFFQNDVYVTRLKYVIQESSRHEKNILRKAS